MMAAVVGLGSTLLTACVLQATPTPVHVPGNQVWIEWENRTEETYAITLLAAGAETPAYGEVEPCTAHGMGLSVEERSPSGSETATLLGTRSAGSWRRSATGGRRADVSCS